MRGHTLPHSQAVIASSSARLEELKAKVATNSRQTELSKRELEELVAFHVA
jgi:hypothetical protein